MTATVRLATEDDATQVRDIYAPFCLHTPISLEEVPPDEAEIRRRIHIVRAINMGANLDLRILNAVEDARGEWPA